MATPETALAGPWFDWATVGTGCISAIAATAAMELTASWSGGGRSFAQLDARCAVGRRHRPRPPIVTLGSRSATRICNASSAGALGRSDVGAASDSLLVTAVGRGEQRAIEELYRRHGGAVFAMALRVLRRRELAEDVVQGVLARLWSRPESFDPTRGSLRTFLLTQAHSQAVDVVRSERSRRAREDRHAMAAPAPYDLEEDVMNTAIGGEVRAAMEALTEVEREAITLAYFGGHTYREVARLLGVAEGTVKSRIRSGLGRLRVDLAEAERSLR